MKKKNLFGMVLSLAIPIMLQNGITNAVGLVDSIMVGSLGTEAMTGVSIAGQLIFVFNLAIFGAMSGPGIFGAQYYGSNDIEGVRNVFRIKLWAAVACAILGIGVFLGFDKFLIGLYMTGNTAKIDPALTLAYSSSYLKIMLIGFIPFSLVQVYATSLRENNESVIPMVAGMASVVTDVVFNYLLIFGKFGFPQMGVEGAAVATVIARFAEFAIIVVWSHASSGRFPFIKKIYSTILVPKRIIGPIAKKSVPILLNEFMWAGGMAALTMCYSMRGEEYVSALSIQSALCNLLNVVFVALGHAVGIIVGQMLGANEFERAKKDSVKLMWFSGGVCIVLTVLLWLFSAKFPMFYDTEDYIRAHATKFIRITALFFPVQGFLNALYFTLRSGGKTLITFLFDSIYTWCVPVLACFLICKLTNLDVFYVFLIIQCADIIKVIIGYIMIKKGIWISNIVSGNVQAE